MSVSRSLSRWSFILAAAALTAGCANAGADDATSAIGDVTGPSVAVEDNRFEPANLEVEVGETVTWVWHGGNPHDVSAEGFASELQSDGTFTQTFDQPGTYDYVCTVHPDMQGTVVVAEA